MRKSKSRDHPLGWERRGLAGARGGPRRGWLHPDGAHHACPRPRRRAGRPGPLSVQTAAPADARAPIGAPRPPPAAPEALGPQLLGGWTRRGLSAGITLDGASDHGVSEALYLRDPDENGVELYRDRPEAEWPRHPDGTLAMFTHRLDVEALLREREG